MLEADGRLSCPGCARTVRKCAKTCWSYYSILQYYPLLLSCIAGGRARGRWPAVLPRLRPQGWQVRFQWVHPVRLRYPGAGPRLRHPARPAGHYRHAGMKVIVTIVCSRSIWGRTNLFAPAYGILHGRLDILEMQVRSSSLTAASLLMFGYFFWRALLSSCRRRSILGHEHTALHPL